MDTPFIDLRECRVQQARAFAQQFNKFEWKKVHLTDVVRSAANNFGNPSIPSPASKVRTICRLPGAARADSLNVGTPSLNIDMRCLFSEVT
jgi:hypothetical protein